MSFYIEKQRSRTSKKFTCDCPVPAFHATKRIDSTIASVAKVFSRRTGGQHETEVPDDGELAYVHGSLRPAAHFDVSSSGVPRSSLQV